MLCCLKASSAHSGYWYREKCLGVFHETVQKYFRLSLGKGAEVPVEVGRCALAWRGGRFHFQKGCFCYLQSGSEVSHVKSSKSVFTAVKIMNLVLNSATKFKVVSRQQRYSSTNVCICCSFCGNRRNSTLRAVSFPYAVRRVNRLLILRNLRLKKTETLNAWTSLSFAMKTLHSRTLSALVEYMHVLCCVSKLLCIWCLPVPCLFNIPLETYLKTTSR